LRSQVTELQPKFPAFAGSINLTDVLQVRKSLHQLVGVPIDRNNILWFEPIDTYKRRLVDVFISDDKHYRMCSIPESGILKSCRVDFVSNKWNKYCTWKPSGSLGYAYCLPNNKDCKLSRPIVPNCKHPLARLFNMAARGFGFILQHIKISHYNLFTTQQFVTELAQLSNVVADFCRLGHASDVVCAQSDIKDMYSEILHTAISSSVHYIRDKWLADHRHGSLCIN
jgi:hypothetical protein